MQVTPGAMHVPPGATPGATPGALPGATHVTIPAMFPLPARPVRQARQLFVVANLFAISVFAALCYDLGAAGGAWTVTALGILDAVGNLLITTWLMPHIGYRRAEDVRAGFNLVVLSSAAWVSGWHFLAWLFVPFATSLAGVPKAPGSELRVAAILGGFAALALTTGGGVTELAAFAGLSLFVYLLIRAHLAFAERMLAERDETLAALAHAQELALRRDRLASIGRLAAGIAHEINNPMCFVTANVDDLLADLRAEPELSPRLAQYRDEILPETVGGIARVNSIAGDLRRLARGEPATLTETDLSDEIAASVRVARTQLRPRQSLEATIAPGLRMNGAARQLGQVTLNLIGNALDAMVDGGTVTVTLARRGSDLELVVADDGPGMPPEVQAHIFEPFFTTKAPGEGMGLGLAVAHSVVTAHRGQITVDTQPGRGTRVTIRLPG
jgi:two-component system NtrC family sensor kinase